MRSEFSSWTPSLLLAICYTEQKFIDEHSAHICVIDTYKMRNGVYHVPDLFYVGLANARVDSPGRWSDFPEEYLVHGIVSGEGYIAVPYAKIRAGLLKVYPWLSNNRSWGYDVRLDNFAQEAAAIDLSPSHLMLLKKIAGRFTRVIPEFPMLISLICLTKRFTLGCEAKDLVGIPEFSNFAMGLRRIIHQYGVEEHWITTDEQYIGQLVEVEHTKTMMRAMIWTKFGRGQRSVTSVE